MSSTTQAGGAPPSSSPHYHLKRDVGFWGLMFVSLGCIIGSGWLMGALNAAKLAGPASLITWVLGAIMLSVLALVYSELATTYPVAGGAGRYAGYSLGRISGFFSGWASFLATVFIPPIEVLAAIAYMNSVGWFKHHFNMLQLTGANAGLLNTRGLIVAICMMVLFTAINLAGAKFMSDSNTWAVIWKAAVPLLAIGVIALSSFHLHNFHTQNAGGFMPHGWNGVFAALTGGVVFALEGFEQAVQLAGEAKNPKKDMSRAILVAMGIGALLYTVLEVVFIAGINPLDLHSWDDPMPKGDYGAYYTLALGIGATWLATILVIDAVISPAGTGIIYVGTSARLTYALSAEKEIPTVFRKVNARGVPYIAILFSAVLGCVAFGPFKSWATMVNVITGATAFMYSFAPLALATLRDRDVNRTRTYQAPMPKVLLPLAFIFTNLIVYWGNWQTTWKLTIFLVVGLVLFVISGMRHGSIRSEDLRAAAWIPVWLLGTLIISYYGNFKGQGKLPQNWDILIVAVWSLAIFYWAKSLALPTAMVEQNVEYDAIQLRGMQDVVAADLPIAVD